MDENKPSATAALILKVILFVSEDATHSYLIPADVKRLSQMLAKHVCTCPRIFSFTIKNKFTRVLIQLTERILNKGFLLHVISRKNYIEKLALESINKGFSQIIILGSGYDTLALRLATKYNNVFCFELDHPNTQILKKTALMNTNLPVNFSFIAADLSRLSIKDVLKQQIHFKASKKTLLIIEGVLMYLSEQHVTNLLTELRDIFPNDLELIFTFMDKQSNNSIQFKSAHPAVNWWLHKQQEHFLWGISKNDIGLKMKHMGFKNCSVIGKKEFLNEYFTNIESRPDLAEGEMICHASKTDNLNY